MDPKTKLRSYLTTNPVFVGLVLKASLRRLLRAVRFRGRPQPQTRFDV
jgi:hypothetical protein